MHSWFKLCVCTSIIIIHFLLIFWHALLHVCECVSIVSYCCSFLDPTYWQQVDNIEGKKTKRKKKKNRKKLSKGKKSLAASHPLHNWREKKEKKKQKKK